MAYCIARTECKLIILDPERANILEPIVKKLVGDSGSNGILVIESSEIKKSWEGMEDWEAALNDYQGDPRKVLSMDPKILPEDNATILFTSGSNLNCLLVHVSHERNLLGTTGLPKGVLSTQRQFLTNIFNVHSSYRFSAS